MAGALIFGADYLTKTEWYKTFKAKRTEVWVCEPEETVYWVRTYDGAKTKIENGSIIVLKEYNYQNIKNATDVEVYKNNKLVVGFMDTASVNKNLKREFLKNTYKTNLYEFEKTAKKQSKK